MTWQEDLRKLDENLASGNLSADEYRTRRDQILSSAVSSPEEPSEGPHNADSTQVVAPVAGRQPSQPQPGQPPLGQPNQPQQDPHAQPQPAPQQEPQPGQPQGQQAQHPGPQHGQQGQQAQPGRPESTQIVSPADPAAHPQAAPGWPGQPGSPAGGFPQPQAGQPADQPPAGQPAQPAHHPASPPAGFAGPPQQRPWNAAQEDQAPPWGGGSFPPLTPLTNSEWAPSQGPGSFDQPTSPGTGRRIALSALAVVLLAGVGVAVWLLFSTDDDPDGGDRAKDTGRMTQLSTAPPSPTSSPLPTPPPAKQTPTDNPSALIELPGEARDGGGEFDKETMVDSKVLPGTVAEALLDTDMGKGLLRTTILDEKVTIGLYAIEVGDQAEAVSMVEEYGKTQVNGSIPQSRELSLQGVTAYASPQEDNSFFRTAYVLYDRMIILDVFGDDPDRVRDMFVEIRDEQIAHAPPSTTDF